MATKQPLNNGQEDKPCELCGDPTGFRIGCAACGRMVCPSCMASQDDEDIEERGEVCEACF